MEHVTRSTHAVTLTKGAPQGIAVFDTIKERYEFAIRQARQGSNYFVGYIDKGRPGLSYGHAEWVGGSNVHIKDLHGLIH